MTQANVLAQMGSTNQTFRNRIINGSMVIDQRSAGASFTPTTSTAYGSCDRWCGVVSVSSKFTMQQSSTAPTGFVNSLLITSSSAYTLSSSDYFNIRQNIEGYNAADLMWGTANAQTVTLSFWVRSSLTGSFGGALANAAYNRSYPFSYTISSANTWEYKTITITGDTSGTWSTTNGTGITVNIGLGAGSTWTGTAGSWSSNTYNSPTGSTQVVATNGATFYITGVQLEAGTSATPFEYRSYGTELALCQRYFEKSQANAVGSGANGIYTASVSDQSNNAVYSWKFAVEKRTTPTMTAYQTSGTSGSWGYTRSGASTTASVSFHQSMTSCANFYMNIGAAWTGCNIYGNLVADAEL